MKKDKISVIGMVVAMEKELAPFYEKAGKPFKVYDICGYKISGFKLYGKKVYVVKSGIGEIYASSATAILIGVLKCQMIFNFGVCGSLVDSVGVLDVVSVKGVVHYDFDLSAIDDVKVGKYPGYSTPIISVSEGDNKALSYLNNLKQVVCASADKFVADENIKEKLNKDFGAEVCDMECAGITLTCKNAGVPLVIIKAVSDGKGGAQEFQNRVNSAVQVYLDIVFNALKGV